MMNLDEYNRERHEYYYPTQEAANRNGIACPKCGEELCDSQPSIILASYPPKKNVHCSKCGFVGYRLA